jgi:hypothetical protein
MLFKKWISNSSDFIMWLEAKSMRGVSADPRSLNKDAPYMQRTSPQAMAFGYTNNPVSSNRINKNILGWDVWFLDEGTMTEEVVAQAAKMVHHVLATFQSMGMRKTMRVPIMIHFGNESHQGAEGLMVHGNANRVSPNFYQNSITKKEGGNRSVGRNRRDSDFVHIYWIQGHEKTFEDTLAHEMTHLIYGTLPMSVKQQIKMLANSSPSATSYGMPSYGGEGSPAHLAGDEWFAEMVANVLFKTSAGNNASALKIREMPSNIVKKLWQQLMDVLAGRNVVQTPGGDAVKMQVTQNNQGKIWGKDGMGLMRGAIASPLAPQPNQRQEYPD